MDKQGKAEQRVELGHRVLVCTTDQYHFILHHKVVQGDQDVALTVPAADSLLSSYKNIGSMSFVFYLDIYKLRFSRIYLMRVIRLTN